MWVDLVNFQTSPDSALSDTVLLKSRTDPRVAGDSAHLLAAWTVSDPSGGSQVMGRRLRGTVGPAQVSPLLPGGGTFQTHPALAWAPEIGAFLVVAEGETGSGGQDLWFRLIDATDTGSVHPLEAQHTRDRYAPAAAWSSARQAFAAVWEEYGPTWNAEVRLTWIAPNGTVDTPFVLLAGNDTLSASAPSVASGPGDTLAVAYRWDAPSGTGIALLLVDTAGQVLGNPIPVNTDGGSAFRSPPRVVSTPTGWAVAWSDDRDGVFRVYVRTFSRDGTPQGPETPVYPDGWASEHAFVFPLPGGTAVVAEVYRPDGEEDLMLASLPAGDTLDLVQDGGTADQLHPSGVLLGGQVLATWTDFSSPDSPWIFLRRLDPSGPAGSPVAVGPGFWSRVSATASWILVAREGVDSLGNTMLSVDWLDRQSLMPGPSLRVWGMHDEMDLVGLSGDTGLVALVAGPALWVLRVSPQGVDTFLLNDTTAWEFPSGPRFLSCGGNIRLVWKTYTGTQDDLLSRTFTPEGNPDSLQDTLMVFPSGLYGFDAACADSDRLWVLEEDPTDVRLLRVGIGLVDTIWALPANFHVGRVASHPDRPGVAAWVLLEDLGGRDRVVWGVSRADTSWGPVPVDTPAVEVHEQEPVLVADTAGLWVLYTSNEQRRGVDGMAARFPWPVWVFTAERASGVPLQLVYDARRQMLRISTPVAARLQVVNLLGRVVREGRVRGRTLWRLSGLRPGVYFIRLTQPARQTSLKILVE